MKKSVKIALLGCGVVGTEVVRLLQTQRADFEARARAEIDLIGIAVRNVQAERDPIIDRDLLTDSPEELIARADVVIELIGGITPARQYVEAALKRGATVVTGNKALLAAHGPQLHELARSSGADLYYEAAVAGAVPVVYGLREALVGDRITRVIGIVNGTTNYILDEMTATGMSFADALSAAQRLGYAEADPTADVDGHDAAAKAAILASLAFHSRVSLDQVPTEGIRAITPEDIVAARAAGGVIKLLAIAERRAGGDGKEQISVRVHPAIVETDNPLASVHGAFNAILIDGEAAGRLMFYGQGAGGAPTASAVMSDVVAAVGHKAHGGNGPGELTYAQLPLANPEEIVTQVQLRLQLRDIPGALATVAGILGEQGVSIEQLTQDAEAEVRLVTHRAPWRQLAAALTALAASEAVEEVKAVLRKEGM